MRPWRDFLAVEAVDFTLPGRAVRDLLMTDFGIDDEWAMQARKSLLNSSQSKEEWAMRRVRMHVDSVAAIGRFAARGYVDAISDESGARIRRLTARCESVVGDYGSHPWFQGRAILGAAEQPVMTAWFDGVLYPTFTPGTRPVLLRAERSRVGAQNVTRFAMEEVQWSAS